jgi:ABC-type oligopeptide transport system ATPase subunit
LITSFEILNEGIFILNGTTGCGKTSIFKAFLNLSKTLKIFNDENIQDIRMHSGLTTEEIRDHYKKFNNRKLKDKKTSVVNFNEVSTTSSIPDLMDIIFEEKTNLTTTKIHLNVLLLLIQVLKFQFYKSIWL